MEFPKELKYTKSHEWVKFSDDTTAQVGITDYAQQELGGIVFVNLPEEGDELTAGTSFAEVESVKAVSDIYAPVSGTVSQINEELLDRVGGSHYNSAISGTMTGLGILGTFIGLSLGLGSFSGDDIYTISDNVGPLL